MTLYSNGIKIPKARSDNMKGFSFNNKTKRNLKTKKTAEDGLPDHKDWYKEGKVTRPYN
jgi:hypothetical protein